MSQRYQAIAKGYIQNTLFEPDTRHDVVTVDEPFTKLPSWLVPINTSGEVITESLYDKEGVLKEKPSSKKI